jgi:hypothetical protein
MSLSGSRLTGTLSADYLTQLQSLFPINASLLPAEKSYLATAQQNLANALANAGGPDIVTEVKNATVAVTGVTTGSGTAPGTVT